MGLVIAAGYGYRSPGLVGAGLSVAGFLVIVASALVPGGATTTNPPRRLTASMIKP